MKLLTALTAAFLIATPAQALPIWATSVARSHCEYLAMGATYAEATMQSYRDNSHWQEEMTAAGRLRGHAINAAIETTCSALESRAWAAHQQAEGSI